MGIHSFAVAAAAKSSTSGAGSSSFLIILVVFGLLMYLMFRSQRKRQRTQQDTQRQVVNGSRIRTTFGVYGTVIDGDDRNVMLEIAPGTQIKILRQAIAVVVPDDEPDGVLHTTPEPDEFYRGDQDSDHDPAQPDLNGDGSTAKPDNRSDQTI